MPPTLWIVAAVLALLICLGLWLDYRRICKRDAKRMPPRIETPPAEPTDLAREYRAFHTSRRAG